MHFRLFLKLFRLALFRQGPRLAGGWLIACAVLAPSVYSAKAAAPVVSAAEFYGGVERALERVPEFLFMRQEAQRLGVKVYLFGGTAAGLAHYVKWDIQRKNGDTRFLPTQFDYDLNSIYRSTQDFDIVVDGPAGAASALQASLISRYPHPQEGGRDAWEVRLLREDLGEKEALLRNPNFLEQHSDSNSTGLIEVSARDPGAPLVRDLRSWESPQSGFLADVLQGKLQYYHSSSHATTRRARAGLNPPILSVIRYLTKAFQYELEILPVHEARLREVIAAFDPNSLRDAPAYVSGWLEKNGRKLYQHAVNLDYASRKLDELGLRQKLLAIPGANPAHYQSLAWWLGKRPLPAFEVGGGEGQTAAELGLGRVAHEANGFSAYESIIRSPVGAPNVFESRAGFEGEQALLGSGFYTAQGERGARGTGFNIRFDIDPRAREGWDFTWVRERGYVIFHNKAALRTVPESLSRGPVGYFRALAGEGGFDAQNRGLRRRIELRFEALSPQEAEEIRSVVAERARSTPVPDELIDTWLKLPKGAEDVELARVLFKARVERATQVDLRRLAVEPIPPFFFQHFPDLIELAAQRGGDTVMSRLAMFQMSRPENAHHTWLIRYLIENGDNLEVGRTLAAHVFSKPHTASMTGLLRRLVEKGYWGIDHDLRDFVFSKPHANGPDFDILREALKLDGSEARRAFLARHPLAGTAAADGETDGAAESSSCLAGRLRIP